jgi:hypothetical protein
MTGELDRQDLYEAARIAFAVLSRPDAEQQYNGFITLSKLENVCQQYEVL